MNNCSEGPVATSRKTWFAALSEYLSAAVTHADGELVKWLGDGLMAVFDSAGAALDAAERVLQRGELFGIYPEGTRSRDGMLYKGHTGAARLAIKLGCPIFPVGIVGTREIQPPDTSLPRLGGTVKISIGRPINVARYTERANDPLALREITDELMFEIRELTGQEYRNTYATKRRSETFVAETAEIPRFATSETPNPGEMANVE